MFVNTENSIPQTTHRYISTSMRHTAARRFGQRQYPNEPMGLKKQEPMNEAKNYTVVRNDLRKPGKVMQKGDRSC